MDNKEPDRLFSDPPADSPEEDIVLTEHPEPINAPDTEEPIRIEKTSASLNCPKSLSEPIALIERLIEENQDLAEGVRMLCQRALVKPDALIEAASNYLAHALDDKNLHLCLEIPPPYLAEELAHDDNAIIAPLVFSHWRALGDSARLVRLSDALIDKAGSLTGATAGNFLLEVAAEVAVQKPLRSSRLIDIARPLVGSSDECKPLNNALRWQEVGDFLREDGASFRSFWLQRLKSTEPAEWQIKEAKEAIAFLLGAQSKGRKIPALILESTPPDTLTPASVTKPPPAVSVPTTEPANEKTAESPEKKNKKLEPAPKPAPPEKTEKKAPPVPATEKKSSSLPAFLIGGLCVLAAGAWVGRDTLLLLLNSSHTNPGSAPNSPLTAEPVAQPATRPTAPPPTQPAAPAPAVAEPVIISPAAPTVAKVIEAPPTPQIVPAANPAPAISASPPQGASPPEAEWRKSRFAAVVKEYPALARWHQMVKTSNWRDTHTMLMGLKSFLPYDGDEFPQLLTLLLLDPPQDPQVGEAVPKIAARRLKPAEFIPLWEKLMYPGSPNDKEIRAAAEAYLSVKMDYLTPETVEKLKKIAAPPAAKGHE